MSKLADLEGSIWSAAIGDAGVRDGEESGEGDTKYLHLNPLVTSFLGMHSVVVFCKRGFVEVAVPDGMKGEEYVYGTFLLHLIEEKGVEEKRACVIAEAAVYKRLYPGLVYARELEEDIEMLSMG